MKILYVENHAIFEAQAREADFSALRSAAVFGNPGDIDSFDSCEAAECKASSFGKCH